MRTTLRSGLRPGLRVLGVALLAALSLAATSAAASPKAPLTKKQFVKRADTACTAYVRQVIHLKRPTNWASFGTYMHKTYTLKAKLVVRLSALRPPLKQRPAYRKLLALARKSLRVNASTVKAIKGKHIQLVRQLLIRQTKLSPPYATLARSLGLRACAPGPAKKKK